MNAATLTALADFPARLEACFGALTPEDRRWTPSSWDGAPGDRFNAIGHVCHLRDVEIDGYQRRFRRTLGEENPTLETIDGYALARERAYDLADASRALADFRAARAQTMRLIEDLSEAQLARPAVFEDYGAVTLRGLIHLLCSHDQQHLAGLQWLLARIAMPAGAAVVSPAARSA